MRIMSPLQKFTNKIYSRRVSDLKVPSESGYHRMRVDGQIRFEYATYARGIVWIRKEKVADSKGIRILADGASVEQHCSSDYEALLA